MQSYQDLVAWQRGMELAASVYRLTKNFLKNEVYGLSSQVQRAAVSVPANVAEGHARDSTKEFVRGVSIAMGSLAEVETQLLLAKQLEYGNPEQIAEALSLADELGRILRGLQKSLKRKLKS